MATAEELLARTVNPETEPHIVIDATRNVYVPDELQNIAVQFDHNIETVIFDCPRYWDGHDLSVMAVFVNYMRADGIVGQFFCNNVIVDENDESIMHFSWTISGNVTYAVGTISFLVCAKTTEEDGDLKQRWSSNLNQQMKVSKGMIESGEIEKLEPDVITSILLRIDTAEVILKNATAISESVKKAMLPAGMLYGDVNGDGLVNSRDLLLINRYLNGEITDDWLDLDAADVNGDGVVDSTDAQLILQYTGGGIDEFEAGICTHWTRDGAYYYYDVPVAGVTEGMSIAITAPDVKIAKTVCVANAVRVYVTTPPTKDTPININFIPDWNQSDSTAADYIKNRPFYLNNHTATWNGNTTSIQTRCISNLDPTGQELVGGYVKFVASSRVYDAPIVGYCTSQAELNQLKREYATTNYAYVVRGDVISMNPLLDYIAITGDTQLAFVNHDPDLYTLGIYTSADTTVARLMGLYWDTAYVDPKYKELLGQSVEVDTTLSVAGKAADAKVVGDQIADIKDRIKNNVHVVYGTNPDYSSFSPGDIILVVTDL